MFNSFSRYGIAVRCYPATVTGLSQLFVLSEWDINPFQPSTTKTSVVTMAGPAEHIPTFTETWGCQMIAYMLDAFFYGVAMLLVAQYFHSHSGKDSKIIKGTVAALGTLASLEFTFISHQIYVDYVERFNNPASLDIIVFTAPLTLCYILKEAKSGVRRTDGMIDKMILYAINRGVATSLCALLNLILFVSVPNTFIFMIPLVPSCQLYVISVVSMLTTRGALRAELGRGGITTLPGSFPLSTYGGSNTYQSYENQPTIPNTTVLTLQDPAVENYSSK
ncbi:hypothetical protein D9757_015214 [Collybiopsis confluens]|uniref:DUF6534 domain-containing protein n=1 Tax=Collybiopsis confluens TaxID=2823264 RepID=A0A8H5C535_9AGAR|nr:hypothetical protein D9757_015214 [Collybiopsis confluens]